MKEIKTWSHVFGDWIYPLKGQCVGLRGIYWQKLLEYNILNYVFISVTSHETKILLCFVQLEMSPSYRADLLLNINPFTWPCFHGSLKRTVLSREKILWLFDHDQDMSTSNHPIFLSSCDECFLTALCQRIWTCLWHIVPACLFLAYSLPSLIFLLFACLIPYVSLVIFFILIYPVSWLCFYLLLQQI